MSQGGEVLEGFLCPLCMKDLGDVIQLQIHFDEAHSKEDQAFVQSLKELFGKAKRILADEDSSSNGGGGAGGGAGAESGAGQVSALAKLRLAPSAEDECHPVSGIRRDLYPDPTAEQLPSQSYTAEFRKIRGSRVDRYATETNRLIVRLDKLLEGMPGEPAKRRDHETAIVTWIDESLVKLCPSCARTFNIARRKHHCRLCGSVMCQDCSQFVDFNFCRKLINPSNLSSYKMGEQHRPGVSRGGGQDTRSVGSPAGSKSGLFKLRKSGSRESLGSAVIAGVLPDSRTRDEFRCCGYCQQLLLHRDLVTELAASEPIVAQFYARLRADTQLGTEMSPQYLAMYDSLVAGESTYHSSDAKMLRLKLLKVAENIDLMSKKIQQLGTDNLPEGAARPRRLALQDQVRRAAVNFIKETLVGLPSLPSDEELAKIQEQRKLETARRIQEERRRAEEARAKYQQLQERGRGASAASSGARPPQLQPGQRFNESSVSYDSGFVLSSSAQQREIVTEVTDDPMLQQIQIITGYIAQARQQNRFDEVHMLETNLKMLKDEFRRQSEVPEESLESRNNPVATPENLGYVSFQKEPSSEMSNGDADGKANPFNSDSDDEYDASGKNPFAE